jgi:hypothetical protein
MLPLLVAALLAAPPAAWSSEERIELEVDYLGLTVGEARLRTGRREGALLPIFLEARTAGLTSVVEIKEQLATFLDVETGLPRWATLNAVEPGWRHSDRVDFDRAAGQATVREVARREKVTVVATPPGTLDFVALIFALRARPLEPGQRHPFKVLAGTTLLDVVAEVVGRETVETGGGTFPAVKVRVPTGFTGKFSEERPTYLWFSDDERRVLVRIVTEFRIGRATARLTRHVPGRAPGSP